MLQSQAFNLHLYLYKNRKIIEKLDISQLVWLFGGEYSDEKLKLIRYFSANTILLLMNKMRKQERNKYEQKPLLNQPLRNQFNMQEEIEEEYVHKFEFSFDKSLTELDVLKAQYYSLIIQYLSRWNKSNIVKYKFIESKTGDVLQIGMEKGQQCVINHDQPQQKNKDKIDGRQKLKMLGDICKGMINLAQLKIIHFDIAMRNVIKVFGGNYKMIDMYDCYLVGMPKIFPHQRNYLEGSNVQIFHEELFKKTKQILKKQYQYSIKGIENSTKLSLLQMAKQYLPKQDLKLLENSSKIDDGLVNKMLYHLELNLQNIYAQGYHQLLKKINEEQLDKIQQARESIRYQKNISKDHRIHIQELKKRLGQNPQLYQCTLSQYYNKLFYANHPGILMQNVYKGSLIKEKNQQFNRVLLQLDLINNIKPQNQGYQNIEKRNESMWLTSKMQNAIKQKIQKIIKFLINKQKKMNKNNKDSKAILQFDFNSDNHRQDSQDSQMNIGELDSKNFETIAKENGLVFQKKEFSKYNQQIYKNNKKKNYIAFQLMLFDFLQNNIDSPLLERPQFFIKLSSKENNRQKDLYCVYQQEKNNAIKEDLNSISKKGLLYVIKFMKNITQGVIELEKYGLFHPQITLNNIIFDGQNFKIKNLRKCYFISNHYRLTNAEQELLTSNKLILAQYFIEYCNFFASNQKLSLFEGKFGSLIKIFEDIKKYVQRQFQQQKKLYHDTDSDILQLQMTIAMFTQFRKIFPKRHAKQLNGLFKQLLKVSSQCLPENDSQKLKLIVEQLQQNDKEQLNRDGKGQVKKDDRRQLKKDGKGQAKKDGIENKRSCASTFYQQLNLLYKTCQVTGHKDQIVFYYHLQNNDKEEQYLCNQCIQQYSEVKIKFYCFDHKKPLLYIEKNQQIKQEFSNGYYCHQCIRPPSSKLNMIDSQTLQKQQNICLQIGCPNTLFPTSKKQSEHKFHQTFTLQQFAKIYPSIDTYIYNIDKQKNDLQDRQSNLSHLKKIYQQHNDKINSLFEMFKKVKDQEYQLIDNIVSPGFQKVNNFVSEPLRLTQFFNTLKAAYRIHNYSKKKGYEAISFEGFLEYANHKYQQISTNIYKKMKQQLNSIDKTLQQTVFSQNIEEKVRQYLQNKYKKRQDLQYHQNQKLQWFINIPQRYEQLVKTIKIQKFQIELQHLAEQRLNSTELIDQYYFDKSKLYQQWIKLISQENEELQNIFKQKKLSTFSKYYKLKTTSIINYISQQSICLSTMKQNILKGKKEKNLSMLQQMNCQIIDQKQRMLQHEQQYINIFFNDLKKSQRQKQKIIDYLQQSSSGSYSSHDIAELNIPQIIQKQKKRIQNLRKTLIKVELSLRFFMVIYKTYPRSLSEQQIIKLSNLTNLQRLEVILNRNYCNFMLSRQLTFSYFLDESVLQRILLKNNSLKQLYIYGGNLQLLPCLRVISQNCKDRTFVFHPDVWNSVKQSKQLQEISNIISKQTIKLQCINIRIRKNLSQSEKQSILQITDKVDEIKLDIVGPFHHNGLAIDILKHIVNRAELIVKAIQINGLDLQVYQQIFIPLSSKIKSLKIVNCRNYDFLINSCSSTLKDIYISGFGKKQQRNQYKTIKAISLCQNIESIQFNDSSFNTAYLNLSKIQALKNIRFRLCKNLSMNFLETLHPKSRKTLLNFELLGFSKLQANFFTQLSRMSALRSLQISQTGNSLAEYILNLQLLNLEILYIKERATTVNNQLLLKIDQKWPKISSLAIPFSETITANVFLQGFSNLKHLAIAKNQFRFEQKYLISRRGNANKRQIFIQEYS